MSFIRELAAKLGFQVDLDPLERFNDEIDDSKSALESMKERAAGVMDQLAKLNQVWELTSKVASTAWGVLKDFTITAAESGAKIADTSAQLGINSTALQRLQYAAEATGSSADTMNKALLEQEKLIRESAKGATPFSEALKQIGLRVEDLKNMSPEERFGRIGDALYSVRDQGERAAISLALFGGEGSKILPLALEGSAGIKALGDEAERLGMVLGEDLVEAGADFDQSVKQMQGMVQGIKNDIGAALMPTITSLVKEVGAWIKENRELIKENVKGFIGGLIEAGKTLAPIITTAASAASGLVNALGGIGNVTAPAIAGLGALKIATLAAAGPWGILAGAAVAAGVAIVGAMTKSEKKIGDVERASQRLAKSLDFEKGLEGKTTADLKRMKDELARERQQNRFVRENVVGLTPKQIMALNEERKLDVENIDEREAKLDAALKAAEDAEAEEAKIKAAEEAKKQADADAKVDEENQAIADKVEYDYLRGKKNKTKDQKARMAELQKKLGISPKSGGAKKEEGKTADELVLAASGRSAGGVLGATSAPGLGTTVNNISIDYSQDNKFTFQLPYTAQRSPQDFARDSGLMIADKLTEQNEQLAAYLNAGKPLGG